MLRFAVNTVVIIFYGVRVRIGTPTAGWRWLKRWRTVCSQILADFGPMHCSAERLLLLRQLESLPTRIAQPRGCSPDNRHRPLGSADFT